MLLHRRIGLFQPTVSGERDQRRVEPVAGLHQAAADMRARRKHYDALGMKPDSSVDYDAVERYYADL